MLGIIASNFLKIGNGWATVEKYASTVVFVGALFFPQFLDKNLDFILMQVVPWFSWKKKHLLNLKRIDNTKENMSGITDGNQNYERCDCKVRIVIGA